MKSPYAAGRVGGIVGEIHDNGNSSVTNSYNTGNVASYVDGSLLGGIAVNASLESSITNCYALNNSISAFSTGSSSSIGRITVNGYSANDLLLNNFALNTMQKNGLFETEDANDGYDISFAEATDTSNIHYEANGWDFNNVWTFDYAGFNVTNTANLPILRAFTPEKSPNVVQGPRIDF